MLITTLLYFLINFSECDKQSVLASYMNSDLIIAAQIQDYKFEGESLLFRVKAFSQYKNPDVAVDYIKYDYPNALFEYNAGVKWLDNMIGLSYIMYLNENDGKYILNTCDRLIKYEGEKALKEIRLLEKFNKSDFSEVWAKNSELDERVKAKPLTNIDSLLNIDVKSSLHLNGYPVALTNFLIDRYGRVVAFANTNLHEFKISEFNSLELISSKTPRQDEVSKYFDSISSKIVKWRGVEFEENQLNAVVRIRWEILEDFSIKYDVY